MEGKSSKTEEWGPKYQKNLKYKKKRIPPLQEPNGIFFSGDGKAELFVDATEATCRINKLLNEDDNH